MSAAYHPLRDRTLAAVDSVFAERVRHSPMDGGRADPERPQREILAPLRGAGQERTNLQGGYSQNWMTRVAAASHVLKIDRAKYPGVEFRDGDAIRAIDRPGAPVFSVLAVDDRQHTRLVIYLGEA